MNVVDISSNMNQAVKDLDKEIADLDRAAVNSIRQRSFQTMKFMMNAAPVKTGFYRASFLMGLNEIPTQRMRRIKSKKQDTGLVRIGQRRRKDSRVLQAGDQFYDVGKANLGHALALFDGKKLSDIHSVFIANNAPHVHFVERGWIRKRDGVAGHPGYFIFSLGASEAKFLFTVDIFDTAFKGVEMFG